MSDHRRDADRAIQLAWNYLYGDGNDSARGHGFATLALAYAQLAALDERIATS